MIEICLDLPLRFLIGIVMVCFKCFPKFHKFANFPLIGKDDVETYKA